MIDSLNFISSVPAATRQDIQAASRLDGDRELQIGTLFRHRKLFYFADSAEQHGWIRRLAESIPQPSGCKASALRLFNRGLTWVIQQNKIPAALRSLATQCLSTASQIAVLEKELTTTRKKIDRIAECRTLGAKHRRGKLLEKTLFCCAQDRSQVEGSERELEGKSRFGDRILETRREAVKLAYFNYLKDETLQQLTTLRAIQETFQKFWTRGILCVLAWPV